jgi:hypothetical protein
MNVGVCGGEAITVGDRIGSVVSEDGIVAVAVAVGVCRTKGEAGTSG